MALVNAKYEFIYVDIGCQGRISDGGVFQNTALYQKLSENQLMLPPADPMPYVFVGDDAFALTTLMLKPYPGVHDKGSSKGFLNIDCHGHAEPWKTFLEFWLRFLEYFANQYSSNHIK